MHTEMTLSANAIMQQLEVYYNSLCLKGSMVGDVYQFHLHGLGFCVFR